MAPPWGSVYTRSMTRALRPYLHAAILAVALLAPPRCEAQTRIGLSLGGLGFVGVVAEQIWDDQSIELLVSTFAFRDASISVVGKQYFGASWLKPAVGAGFWYMIGGGEEGTGSALLARFPAGGDWQAAPGHHVTFEVNIARGLWVDRPDPEDDLPISQRIIPLPAFSYPVATGQF